MKLYLFHLIERLSAFHSIYLGFLCDRYFLFDYLCTGIGRCCGTLNFHFGGHGQIRAKLRTVNSTGLNLKIKMKDERMNLRNVYNK